MREYFISNFNKKEGPYSLNELKEKNINEETLVWFDDLGNEWKKASEIIELKNIINTRSSINLSKKELKDNTRFKKSKKKFLIIPLVSAILIITAYWFMNQSSIKNNNPKKENEKEIILDVGESFTLNSEEKIKLRTFIPKNLPNSDNDLYKTVDILKKLEGYWISESELNDCFETKTGISIYFENKNINSDITPFDNWYFSGYENHNIITDVSIYGNSIILYVIAKDYETDELYESSFVFENFDFLNNKLFYNDGYSGQMIKMKDGNGNLINGIERSENGYGCEYNSKTDSQISEILIEENENIEGIEIIKENENIEDWPMFYVKSEGGLNVRNKAGNDGEKVATLIQNDLVYLISVTDKFDVIYEFDEETSVINKVEGKWVKIKTYSPPKLKGDKILWENNKENVEGYVFDGFLNKLETDLNNHLQGKYYSSDEISLLKQIEGLWISNSSYDFEKECDSESKSFMNIKPLLEYESEDDFWKNGCWYIHMYEWRIKIETIEYTSLGWFKIKGKGTFDDQIYDDEIELKFVGNELFVSRNNSNEVFNKCQINEGTGENEVLNN